MNNKMSVSSGSISDSIFVDVRHGLYILCDRSFPLTTSNFAAHLVGHAAGCDLDQPAA